MPSEPAFVPEPAPNPELLSSLGSVVRGLSSLFWGLPIALVICVQTANGDWFGAFGLVPGISMVPPVLATGLLFYGLVLLGKFQKQERVWRYALDRAKIFALVNVGLSPFLFWYNQMPLHEFYSTMVAVLMSSGLLFLLTLNPVIWRLSAMLPDEALRLETKYFTTLNRYLLALDLLLLGLFILAARLKPAFITPLPQGFFWLLMLLVLIPVAMTMALIWKVKEVILSSVFGGE